MEKISIAIVGGGAAGLFLANALADQPNIALFERGERLGRKLAATGNGQGNITNLAVKDSEYFSLSDGEGLARRLVNEFDDRAMRDFFEELGVLSLADERGRVYPAARQASALTDALRFSLRKSGVETRLKTQIVDLKRKGAGFLLTAKTEEGAYEVYADRVVLCVGGKAAKNFGTDGSAYALATGLGHSLTSLYPSLVQLKTDVKHTKTLKGIRVVNGAVTGQTPTRSVVERGDIIFTEYGVSGDAIFRLSAFLAGEIERGGCRLTIDFLPQVTEETLLSLLERKRERYPDLDSAELLFGVVNNQVGRAILRRAEGNLCRAAALVKAFPLEVTGSLGFDYAQVTKGGIPLFEVTDDLESKRARGLYFAGEALDIDGQCGGFNLQWAFSSAMTVARALRKRGGQVCV